MKPTLIKICVCNKNNTKHKGRRQIIVNKNLRVRGMGVWKGSYMWNNEFLVVKKSDEKSVKNDAPKHFSILTTYVNHMPIYR